MAFLRPPNPSTQLRKGGPSRAHFSPDLLVFQEGVEHADGIGAATHAGHHEILGTTAERRTGPKKGLGVYDGNS